MKQLKAFYVLATIILLGGMICSCTNIYGDDDDNGSSSAGGSNNLKSGQIEMKITPGYPKQCTFDIISQGKITIDWGDGIINEYTNPNGTKRRYTHTFPTENSLYIVKITVEIMTLFDCTNHTIYKPIHELRFGNCPELQKISCYGNQLTVLDVSKCSNLIVLGCGGNQLTSLNVSGCTNLAELWCGANELTASALNILFNSLPTRKPDDRARIDYGNNPGTATCDKTILEKKGWDNPL